MCSGMRRSFAYVKTMRIDSGSTARTLWMATPIREPRVVEVVGRLPGCVAVHALSPFPEIAAAGLDLTPQQALERVAVHVGETRNCPTLQHHRVVRNRRHALGDRCDATGCDFEQNVFRAVAEPRLLGVPATRPVH